MSIADIDFTLRQQAEKYNKEDIRDFESGHLGPSEWIDSPGGVKEDGGKLSYDLDWDFIEAMAQRMDANRHKYPKGNWKKPIDTEKLKEALCRHMIAVMRGDYQDNKEALGHITAVAVNAMMLYYQLKPSPGE